MTPTRVDAAPILRSWRHNSGSTYLRVRADVPADVLAATVLEVTPPEPPGQPVSVWPPVAVPGSVVMYVSDAESAAALQEWLDEFARRLSTRVDGGVVDTFRPTFSPIDRPGTDFFGTAVVLSPRLDEEGAAVPEVLDAVLERALAWSALPKGRTFVRLGTTGFRAEPADVAALLRAGLRDPHVSTAATSADWPRAARQVVITPDRQVLALFGSGQGFDEAQEAIREAAELMAACADDVDEAHAFRTTRALPDGATLLQWSWPALPDLLPGQLRFLRRLAGSRAYDAFGVQLLPTATVEGVRGQIREFSARPVGDRMTLLVHRDAERWFAGGNPTPEELAPARAELGPILLSGRDLERERARSEG